MTWRSPEFVLMVIAMVTLGWVVTTWIRAKHGYPLTDEWGKTIRREPELDTTRQIELLSNGNSDLQGKIVRLEERIAVLERIATDPAERTAREIDALRLAKN
jgi:hypothetical protein